MDVFFSTADGFHDYAEMHDSVIETNPSQAKLDQIRSDQTRLVYEKSVCDEFDDVLRPRVHQSPDPVERH